MSDHVKRLKAALDGRQRVRHALGDSHPDMLLVDAPDLEALLAEAEQLRSARTFLDGQVFAAGWYAHAEVSASLGWDQRETAWRKYREEMAETLASAPPQQPDLDALCVRDLTADAAMQQPEDGDRD